MNPKTVKVAGDLIDVLRTDPDGRAKGYHTGARIEQPRTGSEHS